MDRSDERAADRRIVPTIGGRLGHPVSVEGVRKALAELNLNICTDADMRVLKAMAAVPEETLRRSLANTLHADEHSRAPARAELARRESEEATFDRAVVWDGGPVRREGKR